MAADVNAVADTIQSVAELAQAVATLTAENAALRMQLDQARAACQDLYRMSGRGPQQRSLLTRGR